MGECAISQLIHAKPLTKKISRRALWMRTWPIAEWCSPSAGNGQVDCWMVYHRGRQERVERKSRFDLYHRKRELGKSL